MTSCELTEKNVLAFGQAEVELRRLRAASLVPPPSPPPIVDEALVAKLRGQREQLAEARRQIASLEQELEVLKAKTKHGVVVGPPLDPTVVDAVAVQQLEADKNSLEVRLAQLKEKLVHLINSNGTLAADLSSGHGRPD